MKFSWQVLRKGNFALVYIQSKPKQNYIGKDFAEDKANLKKSFIVRI